MAVKGVLRASDLSGLDGAAREAAERPIRVVLLQPPAREGVWSFLSHLENDGGIGYKPPQGILYIATYLKANSPHQITVIDCQAEQLDIEAATERVRKLDPHLVGISAWTDFLYPSWALGKAIKERLPHTHLSYGGPHVSIYPQETLDFPFADSVIVGDGEVPFFFLANMIAKGRYYDELPGLHLKQHGVKPPPDTFFIHKNLDELPFPDRTLLPIENYSSVLGRQSYITTMITSRGCPFQCTFCKLNFQKTLSRSAEDVVAEFEAIQELGISEVEVYDDTFTWSKKRLTAICEGLIEKDIRIRWAIRDRVSQVQEDLLALMHRAGCRRIHFGVESGVERMLRTMKKNINKDQARNAVELAKKHRFTVLTYFMFGNMGETLEDMEATVRFALELDSDYAQFSIAIPYAGTEMYEEALREGIIPTDYWLEYARSPVPDFTPPHLIESAASKEKLMEIRDEAIRRFYFRPRYVVNQAVSVASIGEFRRKAAMGLSLFRSAFLQASNRTARRPTDG